MIPLWTTDHDRVPMPKHKDIETFFLRAQVETPNDQGRRVEEIDLGAFVNLGTRNPQVLRIHSIQVQFSDEAGLVPTVKQANSTGEDQTAFACVSLTTKATPVATVGGEPFMPWLFDDETVFTASITSTNGRSSAAEQGITSSATDLAPQHLVNGYLVGVDTLYLYGIADDDWNEDLYISICMECSTEAVDKESAVNLALSQS